MSTPFFALSQIGVAAHPFFALTRSGGLGRLASLGSKGDPESFAFKGRVGMSGVAACRRPDSTRGLVETAGRMAIVGRAYQHCHVGEAGPAFGWCHTAGHLFARVNRGSLLGAGGEPTVQSMSSPVAIEKHVMGESPARHGISDAPAIWVG